MRYHLGASGLRLSRPGRSRLVGWGRMLPALLTSIVLGLAVMIATDRQEPTLAWFLAPVPGAREVGVEIFREVNRQAWQNLLTLGDPPAPGAVPRVSLIAGDDAINQMLLARARAARQRREDQGQARPPEFAAYYSDEADRPMRCKISGRGVGVWHSNLPKPSFRVRIRQSDVLSGRRELDLIRPEDPLGLSNWLPARLGQQLGLPTEDLDHVMLYYNGHYLGVYLRGTRPGEDLSVRQDRMPGTYFKGDSLGMQYAARLWQDLSIWKVFGEQEPEQMKVLADFVAAANGPHTRSNLEELGRVLDTDAMARWAALCTLVGSYHTDLGHNHLYYLDGSWGKLVPVLWDPNGLGVNQPVTVPVDGVMNPVMDQLTRDPAWVHRRNQVLWRLLQEDASPEQVERQIHALLNRIGPALRADPTLSGLTTTQVYEIPRLRYFPGDQVTALEAEVLDWYRQRCDRLRAYLKDARFSLSGERMLAFGTVAVRATWPDGRELLACPGLSQELTRFGPPGPRSGQPVDYALPVPLAYELPEPASQARFFNAVTGDPVEPGPPPAPVPGLTARTLPATRVASAPERIVLGPGEVHLTRDLEVGPGDTLLILAGTRLRLDRAVDLTVRGRLEAAGTKLEPIEFLPSSEAPWGAVTVWGPASRARLEHVRMRAGSVTHQRGFAHRAMLNVLHCQDFVASHCRFRENRVGDDAVNAVQSRVLFQECSWDGAASDALDLDMCHGRIQDCRFQDSGNDGMDLSTSDLEVTGCSAAGSGDKGISIGERTRAVLRDCTFERCSIGVQIKDDSEVQVQNCRFLGNSLGVDAYRKKILFVVGGRVSLVDCEYRGNGQTLRQDALSEIRVVGTAPGLEKAGSETVVRLPGWAAGWLPGAARPPTPDGREGRPPF